MASAQEIARRIRSNSSHSRETIRGPIKATSPASTTRRASEGVLITERPSSRCTQRPYSGGFLDEKIDELENPVEERPYSRPRPSTSRSLDSGDLTARRARMLQRQNATTVDPDEHQYYCPTPPQVSRPKSAKGRPRSRSGIRPSSRSGTSMSSDINSNDSPPPQFHQPCGSFSRYTPLPSIGSQPTTVSSPDSGHNSPAFVHHYNMNPESDCFSYDLTQNINKLSLAKGVTPPPEPSENDPDRIQLAVKLLDGSRHERWFSKSDTLLDVLTFAGVLSGDESLLEECEICTADFPSKVFKDMNLTLDVAGLQSRTVLHIQER